MEIAPPVSSTGLESKSPILLILLGLVTTVAALGAVWGINLLSDDFNLMGLYMLWIIPVGALLVGVAAGSGYGMGSWWTGVRIVLSLNTCPGCAKGHLFAASLTGHGNDIHRQELGGVDLSDDLTRQLS